MLSPWRLPKTVRLGEQEFDLHTDFRDILDIFSWLQRQDLPLFIRWQVALGLFYVQPVPEGLMGQAIGYLEAFLRGGRQEAPAGPKLLDWELDGDIIIADVNKAAGTELRALPYVHWWTFLAWFHGVGPGQLSALVSVREAVQTGKKLEPWQKDYLRENRSRVLMQKPLTPEQLAEKQRLENLLK